MIWTRFRRPPKRGNIAALYGMIVAQSRSPSFYRDLAVPDTVNGRFDMIVLHLALVMWRLSGSGAGQAAAPQDLAVSQGLFDTFCRDMDGNLREMGISDLKVPKEMKRMGEAFYGRISAYGTCFSAETDTVLAAAISRNIYDQAAGQSSGVEIERMTAYTRAAARMLLEQQPGRLADGQVRFPDPDAC